MGRPSVLPMIHILPTPDPSGSRACSIQAKQFTQLGRSSKSLTLILPDPSGSHACSNRAKQFTQEAQTKCVATDPYFAYTQPIWQSSMLQFGKAIHSRWTDQAID